MRNRTITENLSRMRELARGILNPDGEVTVTDDTADLLELAELVETLDGPLAALLQAVEAADAQAGRTVVKPAGRKPRECFAIPAELWEGVRNALEGAQSREREPEPVSDDPERRKLVLWVMEFDAATSKEAARKALTVHRDPESIATEFYVLSADREAQLKALVSQADYIDLLGEGEEDGL